MDQADVLVMEVVDPLETRETMMMLKGKEKR